MAKKIEKVIRMSEYDIIRYQIITYCFTNRVDISEAEMDCLALLARNGECKLIDFLYAASSEKRDTELEYQKEIFKTSQTVRNFLIKAEKLNLVTKSGTGKKTIKVNPDLNIFAGESILLDLKVVYLAS